MKLRTFYISGIIITALVAGLMPWYYAMLSALIFITVLFLACINLSWNFFMPIACKKYTKEKVVALSFDDGPALYTSKILDTLKANDVQATFFCIGKNITANEQTLQRIKEEGHLIGNHSYSHHFWFDLFRSGKMLADMRRAGDEVHKITGCTPRLFRPPYGVINPNLTQAITKGGYTPVGWSIRSFDTKIKDPKKLLSRIMTRVSPGDIILLHDSMEVTANILPLLIQQLNNTGYKITRLDKMLNINAYA